MPLNGYNSELTTRCGSHLLAVAAAAIVIGSRRSWLEKEEVEGLRAAGEREEDGALRRAN